MRMISLSVLLLSFSLYEQKYFYFTILYSLTTSNNICNHLIDDGNNKNKSHMNAGERGKIIRLQFFLRRFTCVSHSFVRCAKLLCTGKCEIARALAFHYLQFSCCYFIHCLAGSKQKKSDKVAEQKVVDAYLHVAPIKGNLRKCVYIYALFWLSLCERYISIYTNEYAVAIATNFHSWQLSVDS